MRDQGKKSTPIMVGDLFIINIEKKSIKVTRNGKPLDFENFICERSKGKFENDGRVRKEIHANFVVIGDWISMILGITGYGLRFISKRVEDPDDEIWEII
ncbi:MAG: hypothetical protein WDK96_03175 [Candidatus Paceibacterota bacterium]|jgi:hypothetical protein